MSQRALTELLRGIGAHAAPAACVEDVSLELASCHIDGFPHSIAELVFHMNYWMEYELRRIQCLRPHYPQHNADSFPSSPTKLDAPSWDKRKSQFVQLLEQFNTLARSSPAELEREVESVHEGDKTTASSLEAVLWQMVAHNSYHVGQIALIRRALGAWPPPNGGDTW
jgi:uncharacterized damage-inducible protein DinB